MQMGRAVVGELSAATQTAPRAELTALSGHMNMITRGDRALLALAVFGINVVGCANQKAIVGHYHRCVNGKGQLIILKTYLRNVGVEASIIGRTKLSLRAQNVG